MIRLLHGPLKLSPIVEEHIHSFSEVFYLNMIPSLIQPEILLVDDTPEHIELAISILHENNYKIKVATKGQTALKLLEQHSPDLILLDVQMPEMDGFALCKRIKSDPSLAAIPIIFITANNDETSIKRGFELGAQDYVIKPFNVSELLARVNTHIQLKQQAESLRAAYQELDSFCYSVSHDLKAPLHSIRKLTEYLIADCFDKLEPEEQELLKHIEEKSLDVIVMIERLLEFSKMCKLEMQPDLISLEAVFNETYEELIQLEPNRKVRFFAANLPKVQGDIVMLKLVALNILSNALKFTRNRKIAEIEVFCSEKDKEYVLSVKDNGEGFDMQYSAKLFGVFQRLHSQEEFEGSGVGLAIVQRILKRHQGKVWITSEAGKGTTLFFSLPKN